jgi:hypothetical protein
VLLLLLLKAIFSLGFVSFSVLLGLGLWISV